MHVLLDHCPNAAKHQRRCSAARTAKRGVKVKTITPGKHMDSETMRRASRAPLNDEADLNITDTAFAARQIEIFQQDVAQSKAITNIEWRQRPLVEKLIEHSASLLRLQM